MERDLIKAWGRSVKGRFRVCDVLERFELIWLFGWKFFED